MPNNNLLNTFFNFSEDNHNQMKIREYSESDKEGILLLHDEFEKEYFSEFYSNSERDRWEVDLHNVHSSYSKNKGKFWVIDHNNEIIGMVGIVLLEDTIAELKRMRVKSTYRGQGLGKKLLTTAENYCRGLGITEIVLSTAKRLKIARKLYESNDYELYDQKELLLPFRFTILFYRKYL
ncbi:MAG: GNAT family N-acetyltransferase [Candidatus Hodarchaeota archaeon]